MRHRRETAAGGVERETYIPVEYNVACRQSKLWLATWKEKNNSDASSFPSSMEGNERTLEINMFNERSDWLTPVSQQGPGPAFVSSTAGQGGTLFPKEEVGILDGKTGGSSGTPDRWNRVDVDQWEEGKRILTLATLRDTIGQSPG